MTALIVVGAAVGYLLIGFVTSIVFAAKHDVDADGAVWSGTIPICILLWPICAIVAVGWLWKWSVLKLNPNFKSVGGNGGK